MAGYRALALRCALQPLVFIGYVLGTLGLAIVVLAAWALYELYRLKGWPEDPEVSNCWAFAIPLFLRSLEQGEDGYLVVDKSSHAPVPHVRFAPDIHGLYVEECKPIKTHRGLRGVLDSLFFRCRIRRGLGEEKNK